MSNARLCEAALEHGLDKFILTKAFNAMEWRPTYMIDVGKSRTGAVRPIAGKTLADIFKALIGAGKVAGGHSMALSWTKTLLCEVDLPSLEVGRRQLFDSSPRDVPLPTNFQPLETLAAYSFKKKALLIEAMTHSSSITAYACYDRLAFLGNAIIESIVGDEIYGHENKLSHALMNIYRTAVVNGQYLGFVALEWHVTQKRCNLRETTASHNFDSEEVDVAFPLWRFLMHSSRDITDEIRKMEGRFASLRDDIAVAIESGSSYPWALLARLQVNDFYADVVESLVGAVWTDSGSMEHCRELLDRMGVLRYLRRIIQDQVHTIHPKEELQILAGQKAVTYDVGGEKDTGKERQITCAVFVGDRMVTQVHGGVDGDEVRVKAAAEAVSLLKADNGR
jgi:dsRNA-specific ribonuclease